MLVASGLDELENLVSAIVASPKYARISTDVIRGIGSRELAKGRSMKEAIKATKNKLHQIGGAYLDSALPYAQWQDELQIAASSGDEARIRHVCVEIMRHHSSTRERLPILDIFYAQTFSALPRIGTVLDIACGFNPLAIPWMPFHEGVQYYAYDMYRDMTEFINQFMHIIHAQGQAEACDVAGHPPARSADLALLLKILPCIEQLDRAAGLRLLEVLHADYLLISFPVRSLGGRNKGMAQNYETRFWELLAGKPWAVQRFEFATELAFLVSKG